MYEKAVLAYGVVDPKGAYDHVRNLYHTEVAAAGKSKTKAKPISLSELEKKGGLDLGGRKAFIRNMAKQAGAAERSLDQNNRNIIQP